MLKGCCSFLQTNIFCGIEMEDEDTVSSSVCPTRNDEMLIKLTIFFTLRKPSLYLFRNSQNATAEAAATFSESTSCDMGMRTT